MTDRQAFDEVCGYTLARGDVAFIHQNVVDAYAAQTATAATKPIKLTFALVGLFLHCAKGFTGKEVQRAHQYLARRKREWPEVSRPRDRGAITVRDVLAQPPGRERDAAIERWSQAVWQSYQANQGVIEDWLSSYGEVFDAGLFKSNAH